MSRPKEPPRTKPYCIRMPIGLKTTLDAIARQRNITTTDLVVHILCSVVDKLKGE